MECACWPHLFWIPELCFSVERLTDPRRARRHRGCLDTLEERLFGTHAPAGNDPYADDVEDEDVTMHSVRRSFAAKTMGPLWEYSTSYELLHFVFDLSLWSDIGATRNLGYELPMRLMMARHPMSPLYWQSVHNALIDMVRQCGYPRLFWTKAPYEKTFPHHAFLDDQLSKQLLSRTRLPLPETLHQTRVMTEIVRGCLTGQNGRRGAWSRHLLGSSSTENRPIGRIAYMTRIEFQDGTRKQETQDYHGSGRPHLHSCIFSEFPHVLRLDKIASAHIPSDDEALRAHVESSQLDNSYELHGKYILKRLNGIQSQKPLDCIIRSSTMIEVYVDASIISWRPQSVTKICRRLTTTEHYRPTW